jgi:hypothetical protein
MAFILMHAAILAESNIRHYVLTETWDAWESWDIIHNSPDRLRWGIWAYLHAAVKTPEGLKMPSGNYVSWGNQGKKLLTDEDVSFLTREINSAFLDASQVDQIYGSTLVYNRKAMEWQTENAPHLSIKEWIDEQAGSVMKWSIPIMSSTRLEYLPHVNSDLFIFQTPVHMEQNAMNNLIDLVRTGEPVAIWGCTSGGIDPGLLAQSGIKTSGKGRTDTVYKATYPASNDEIYRDIPNEFSIYQPMSETRISGDASVIYQVNNSPTLILDESNGRNLMFWDPPELAHNMVGEQFWNWDPMSTDAILGSIYPWVLTARILNQMLMESGKPYLNNIDPMNPVSIHSWKLADGTYQLLASDTEEGINHSEERMAKVDWRLPGNWTENKTIFYSHDRSPQQYIVPKPKFPILLDHGEIKLYSIRVK